MTFLHELAAPSWVALTDRQLSACPAPERSPRTEPRSGLATPETSLCAAVLADAVRDLLDQRPAAAELRADAEAWVKGAAARLPFAVVCEALGLDADRCRSALLNPRDECRAAALFAIGCAGTAA